ncbi:glycoside hydrolase family 99-like domain-containing protein [Pedobacter heparinus]|uniref:Glycosyltransferase WbsX n=1 Tax=Pedobacter heparinus (strain ATCC 13125 / DSM 2366 / CIP 104194 / JCM 7457 / NBRC 12017 / NCIMB 9290 / NRRL B-14731 / HIM 762-3) TaxID=485917 RepID=C6XSJ2_PEDHD|nr:glycoside hydrolase family 99-like domain-containing protein [Pedobacter heparinus]ACU05555.1 hypothetical protein Phep_3361 [Pedobacter heparinus DSM 2366]
MKKIINIALCIIVLASCKKDPVLIDKDKYIYDIPAIKLTSDAKVGAYYFNYTATDWNKAHSDTSLVVPVGGKSYNAVTDAAVFPQQLNWADEAGVDYLIFKWNAAATDNSLLSAFASRRTNQNVKMVIGFNTAHLNATNAAPLTGTKLQTMVNEFKTLVTQHISKDYYYKIGGRPVILITPLNLSSSALTSIDYKMVMASLRTEFTALGINPYFIGELSTGWTAPVNFDQTALAAMDAIVLNTWNTPDYDRWYGFYSYVDLSWQNWKTSLDKLNVEYVPCIFPGYNEPSAATQRIIERTEKNYVDYTNVAKRNMGTNQMVIINSWNDFSKGTALEPSKKFNKQFLGITRREFKVQ